jgi:eukaryotic-like serine/threonine-protein kinase
MALTAGTRLGPYEILAPIGAGGMGEVYKARDTRLDRIVAVKVSRTEFSERFEREARAIATLNHSHICQLYDVVLSKDAPNYLVMEYIEGAPLQGPLPLDQTLKYAAEICDALDAAHRKNITHRDLKPANILVTKQGIKLLDFGLAKVGPGVQAGEGTMTMALTGKGEILGTFQYMSPEQINGQDAGPESDIFSFGLVLYEMLTGKRAFDGATPASVIAAILERPTPSVGDVAPPALDRVLKRCLEKDPEKRWQSARDLKAELEWLAQAAPAPAPLMGTQPVEAPAKKLRLWQGMAALLALVALGLAGWMFWPKTVPPAQVIRFQVPSPDNVTVGQTVSLSPDGRKLVFQAASIEDALWIRDLDALEWRRIPGTEGAMRPFWSPDSKFLAFGVQNQLKKIDVSGGQAQTLCTVPIGLVQMGSWNRDGVIIFRGGDSLWKISQAGGIATAATSVDASREQFHAVPTFLPDGKHFIYVRGGGAPETNGIYAGSLDAKPAEQSRERIMPGQNTASYVNGYLLFMRENTLMAQAFDAGRLKLRGEPTPVAEHVAISGAAGVFSVTSNGALAYRAETGSASYQLTWFDRQGKILSTFGQPSADQGIVLSPDGTRGAVRDARDEAAGDLWTLDFVRGVRTRFTFRQSPGSWEVAWSPDGSRIAYAAGNLRDTLYERASSGAGDEKELLKEATRGHIPTSWSRDGRFLLYYTSKVSRTSQDLWVLPLQGDHKPVPLLATEFNEKDAVFSPDMRWIAYDSDESGRFEVYVRPFMVSGPSGAPSLGEGKWQVSRDGGDFPWWRPDGKEIIFQGPPRGTAKMAVDVRANGAAFEAGVPQQLFIAPLDFGWGVAPDGKRLLLAVPSKQENVNTPITVLLNWPAQLQN